MKGELSDRVRVLHVLDAISEVKKYLERVSYPEFKTNSEKKFATIKQIEIIGEACNRLSEELKAKHPAVSWKEINGFRNISIHEYFSVDYQIVWEVAKNDLPVLAQQFGEILQAL